MGLFGAGMSWFIVEVARRDVYTNPKATREQLRDAERSRREFQRFGPTWRRISLVVAAIGAGLVILDAALR